MSALDAWRTELRGLVPCGFLRRDQGEGLFVSDYPRRGDEAAVSQALRQCGYVVELKNGLAYLDGGLEKYLALSESLPNIQPPAPKDFFWLHALALHLQTAGAAPSPENLPLLRLTLKLLDQGDMAGLDRLLSPAVAKAQRKHISPPRAAGQLILRALQETKGSGKEC